VKLTLKSGSLNYFENGRGPVVLLLHAFPLNQAMWKSQVAALSSRFRVITPDIRGFGQSLPASSWTIEEMCDDLAEFLDRMDVASCALVGLSMGGYIALPFWSKYPTRVHQLVLANTRARADNDTEKAARTEMIAALEQSGTAILPDRMLPRLLQPNPYAEVVRLVRSMIEQVDVSGAIYALMAMRDRPDQSTVLYRINCPALVVAGENDVITRKEECRGIAEIITGGRFVEIPNAGHLSNLENPEDFNRALDEFLL